MIYKNIIYKNEAQTPLPRPNYISSQMNFIFRARMLWRDLATWLKAYEFSIFGGLENTDDLSQRLFRIPSEYGNYLRVFFGDQPTEQFMLLTTQNIAILQSLFAAQINQDVDEVNNLTHQAYQNVHDMATLLASINPYWSYNDWVALLTSFTNMQIEGSTMFLTENYTRNIAIFDRLLSHTNIMGDYFSEGLINYFILREPQATNAWPRLSWDSPSRSQRLSLKHI